jgi:PST family polysaccharide transporter
VASFTFVAYAVGAQHSALMRRSLMFRELAVVDIGASAGSAAIAIAAAFSGFGYWSLIVRPIATPTFYALGVWWKCGWLPSRPVMTPAVKEMLSLGLHATGFCLSDFAARSSDRIAVGYMAGAAALGHYQNALFVYDNLLDVMVFPLHGVAVASLSKLRHDLPALRLAWSKALTVVAFYSAPVFGLLALTSQDIVVLFLGRKWESAGFLLSIMAFRGFPHSIERTLGWLHITAGRADRWMRWGVFSAGAQFVTLFCGLPFGIVGIVVAYVIGAFVLVVPAIAYAGAPLGIRSLDVVRVVWRPLVASTVATLVGRSVEWALFEGLHPLVRAGLLGLVFLPAYFLLATSVFGLWAPVRITGSTIRGFLRPQET